MKPTPGFHLPNPPPTHPRWTRHAQVSKRSQVIRVTAEGWVIYSWYDCGCWETSPAALQGLLHQQSDCTTAVHRTDSTAQSTHILLQGRKENAHNGEVAELTLPPKLPPPVTVPKKSFMHSQRCSFSLDKNSLFAAFTQLAIFPTIPKKYLKAYDGWIHLQGTFMRTSITDLGALNAKATRSIDV